MCEPIVMSTFRLTGLQACDTHHESVHRILRSNGVVILLGRSDCGTSSNEVFDPSRYAVELILKLQRSIPLSTCQYSRRAEHITSEYLEFSEWLRRVR